MISLVFKNHPNHFFLCTSQHHIIFIKAKTCQEQSQEYLNTGNARDTVHLYKLHWCVWRPLSQCFFTYCLLLTFCPHGTLFYFFPAVTLAYQAAKTKLVNTLVKHYFYRQQECCERELARILCATVCRQLFRFECLYFANIFSLPIGINDQGLYRVVGVSSKVQRLLSMLMGMPLF